MTGGRRGACACLLALLALTVAGFAGCGSGGDDSDGSTPTTTTGSDSSRPQQFTDLSEPIEVEVGESFEIVLDANPTTGYRWKVTIASAGQVVTAAGRSYEPDSGSENLAGGGGKETFSFEAVKQGEAKIDFEYLPPGKSAEDGDDGGVQTETAKITVR